MIRHFLAVLTALLISTVVFGQGVTERTMRAIERLQTDAVFRYQGVDIPVLDLSYHEWSSDSVTWSKTYTEGDCYLRISNDVKTTWVGINVCGGSGTGTSQIDTVIICSDGVCDTITTGAVTVNIPAPITITGTTGNTSTDSTHTHDIVFYVGDLEDVDTTARADGYVLKWNEITQQHEYHPDLTGAGASGELTVQDLDGTPSVSNVTEINLENGHLTDNGAGAVTIDFSLEPSTGEQDFFRTDTVDVTVGDTFLTFSSPLPANDYIVANAYALYSNGERQSLSYDSTAVDGFRVLGVLGESEVHYLVIRNLDSLGVILDSYGKVASSDTDVLGFLNSKTDDSTITIINNDLHVIPEFDTVHMKTDYTPTGNEATGTSYWDEDNFTYSDVLYDGVIGQRYEEIFATVKNTTGVDIDNGTPLMFGGIVGSSGKIEADLAIADGTFPASYILGVATSDIADNDFGKVTAYGRVRGVNTTGAPYGETWLQGDAIYVSTTTAGWLTNVEPNAPYPSIRIGVVSLVASNGEILVNPVYNSPMEGSSDVNGTPLAKTGQFYVWDNDSMYFDANYNVLDTTADLNLDTLFVKQLNVNGLTYTNSYWSDVSIPLTGAASGANAPDLEAFGGSGIYQRAFAGTSLNETVFVEGQFPHSIVDSSDVEPHLHISPSTTPVSTDTVVIEFEYSWASMGSVFPTSDTIVTIIPIGDVPQWGHYYVDMSDYMTAIGQQSSSIVVGRITRLQNHVSDTYANDLFIFTLDIHYEFDKVGSDEASPSY